MLSRVAAISVRSPPAIFAGCSSIRCIEREMAVARADSWIIRSRASSSAAGLAFGWGDVGYAGASPWMLPPSGRPPGIVGGLVIFGGMCGGPGLLGGGAFDMGRIG